MLKFFNVHKQEYCEEKHKQVIGKKNFIMT